MRQALRALVNASVLSAGLLITATLPLHAAQKSTRPAGDPPGVAIASAHALATDAGIEMIRAGGNAFDAAVAVSATLAVVEPISSGIGGGGFFLLHDAQERKGCVRRCARDRAGCGNAGGIPRREGRAQSRPRHQRTVVGRHSRVCPAALVHVSQKYGKLPLKTSLAPAIRIAPRRLRGVSAARARLRQPPRGDGALPRYARGVPRRRQCRPRPVRSSSSPTLRARWNCWPTRASTASIAAKSPPSCSAAVKEEGGAVARRRAGGLSRQGTRAAALPVPRLDHHHRAAAVVGRRCAGRDAADAVGLGPVEARSRRIAPTSSSNRCAAHSATARSTWAIRTS